MAKEKDDIETDNNESDATVITTGTLLRWGGFLFAFVSMIVSVVWYIAGMKGEMAALQIQQQTLVKRIDEVDAASKARHELQEKELDRLRQHSEETDRAIVDLSRKLDVAVVILERIDKRSEGGTK